jgi:diacylglycerol kinase
VRSWLRAFVRGFGYAGRGIGWMLRTQRNARVHLAAAVAAVGLGLWLGLSAVEWAVLALTIGLVLTAEALNTALEAIVDLVSPEHHALAGRAKDAAAGAVLLLALASVGVGLALFGPRLLARLGGL